METLESGRPMNRAGGVGKPRRRSRGHQPHVEIAALESRTYFSAVYPTPAEQYLLELINRARANPTAEVQRTVSDGQWPAGVTPDVNEGLAPGTISTNPAQPLAMNPYLLDAATKFTSYLFTNPATPPHQQIVNGVTLFPTDRMTAAGYNFNFNGIGATGGENVWTVFGPKANDNILDDMNRMEEGSFVDYYSDTAGTDGRGHRALLLNPGVNEVGLGVGSVASPNPDGSSNPEYISTQDYANAGNGSFLCGVAYNDLNHDQFYEPGEELAGVTITATSTTDTTKIFSTTTWSSGGYSLPLAPGTYIVTATGGNIGTPAPQTITITTQNVEAGFIASSTTPSAPVIAGQPQDTTPFSNATTFSFSVSASGYPVPAVQWQSAPYGSTTFTPIPGATSYTYKAPISPSLNGSQFQAVLTNSQGSVTSKSGTLTVLNAPLGIQVVITQQPVAQTANDGDTVTFTANATGYTAAVWLITNPGGQFGPVPHYVSMTNTSLTVKVDPSLSGYSYSVHYSNANSDQYTNTAALTVNAAPAAPTVTVQPQPQTAPAGGTATLAVGTAGDPDPTITWVTAPVVITTITPAQADVVRSAAVRSSSPVVVGTGGTLQVTAPPKGKSRKYTAIITNGNGSVTTRTVTVSGNTRSALADELTNLKTASKYALASIAVCKKATLAALANLTADLRRLKAAASVHASLRALAVNEQAARSTFTRNESGLLHRLISLATKVDRLASRVKTHPGDAASAAQLQTELTALQAASASSTAPADATNCKLATEGQLNPISAAAPMDLQLQRDVFSAENNAYNISQSLQAPMVIAQSVVTRIVADA